MPLREVFMPMSNRLLAEFIGTFWLVFGGVGSAVYAAKFPEVGIGFLGVALAFGFTVLTAAASVGQISGGHFNPAVTVGLWAGGRFAKRDVFPYVATQVVASIFAALVLYLVARGMPGFDLATNGLGANGYGVHSPGGYSLLAGMTAEVLLTFMFLIIIMGATSSKAPASVAPIVIGLGLTLIHLVDIPLTNASVNPARSTGPALVVGGWALAQLWMFWVAPMIGGALGGVVYRVLAGEAAPTVTGERRPASGVRPATAH
jgi:aquaporin Z